MIKKSKLATFITTSLVVYLVFPTTLIASTLYFPHTNHQGSVIGYSDENGELVGNERYYVFGEEKHKEGDTTALERAYTGQVKDKTSDLYYYNARYYDPELSVFISPDPAGDNLNAFGYVGGNPVNLTDPTGYADDAGEMEGGCSTTYGTCDEGTGGSTGGSGGDPTNGGNNPSQWDPGINPALEIDPYIPYWFVKAIEGDYSSLPPMGFSGLDALYKYIYEHGLASLFQVASASRVDLKLIENDLANKDEEFWSNYYETFKESIRSEDDLVIVILETKLNGWYGLHRMIANVHVIQINSDLESRKKVEVLLHEYRHAQDTVLLDVAVQALGASMVQFETESNAYFTVANQLWVPESSRQGNLETLNRFSELRRLGLSYDEIMGRYNSHRLFDPIPEIGL